MTKTDFGIGVSKINLSLRWAYDIRRLGASTFSLEEVKRKLALLSRSKTGNGEQGSGIGFEVYLRPEWWMWVGLHERVTK